MRVVIADDSRIERGQVKRILLEAGHQVVAECKDGDEAIAAVAKHRPDLVVLDVIMLHRTGIEAARHIARGPWIPAIVFATKNSQRSTFDMAEKLGASLAVKPYNAVRFLEAVERAYGEHRRRTERTQ